MMKKEGLVSELGIGVNRQVGLGSHSLILYPILPPSFIISHKVFVDVKHDEKRRVGVRARELCEQAGGPELSFSIPFFPPAVIIRRTVSGDVKHHERRRRHVSL